MARIRTIKPEFPHSESMGAVSRDARLLFILLWTLADDSGRLRGNSRMLASLLFPYDNDAQKLIDDWLAELDAQSCIVRFKVDGATYIEICNWLIHQKIDRPSRSKIPAFIESSSNPRESSRILVGGSKDLRTKDLRTKDLRTKDLRTKDLRTKDQGPKEGPQPVGFDDFFNAYDKKVSRPAAERAWRKIKLTDELLVTILDAAKLYRLSTPDKTYRKNPATWLKNECWNDEVVSNGGKAQPHPQEDFAKIDYGTGIRKI